MSELNSARLWRAATCVLAAGWVVVACGGGGDDDAAAVDARSAVVGARPTSLRVPATASATPTEPCRPLASPHRAARPDTTSLEREFVDELRSEMALGVATGAGSAEVADPFEGQ